jgi:hypothetical protein
METRTLEALAILRHLRWGYVRKSLQWLIVGVGITAIEPHAAVWFGDTVGWATGWVGWAVIMWSVLPVLRGRVSVGRMAIGRLQAADGIP